MKLGTQIRYSVRILLDIAMHQRESVVKMNDIAARQKISVKYLEQLICPFKAAGFIESRRGRNGGHRLAKRPEEITLAQIIRIFENEYRPHGEEDDQGYSEYQDTLIREAWEEAKTAFYERLEAVTLADLSIDTTKKLWCDADMLIFL